MNKGRCVMQGTTQPAGDLKSGSELWDRRSANHNSDARPPSRENRTPSSEFFAGLGWVGWDGRPGTGVCCPPSPHVDSARDDAECRSSVGEQRPTHHPRPADRRIFLFSADPNVVQTRRLVLKAGPGVGGFVTCSLLLDQGEDSTQVDIQLLSGCFYYYSRICCYNGLTSAVALSSPGRPQQLL